MPFNHCPIAESLPQSNQDNLAGKTHLSFLFDDAVSSFRLSAEVTLGVFTSALDKLYPQRFDNLVAVDAIAESDSISTPLLRWRHPGPASSLGYHFTIHRRKWGNRPEIPTTIK